VATETVPYGCSIERKAPRPMCGNVRHCAELLHPPAAKDRSDAPSALAYRQIHTNGAT
jgi:hypothetical protein